VNEMLSSPGRVKFEVMNPSAQHRGRQAHGADPQESGVPPRRAEISEFGAPTPAGEQPTRPGHGR